MNRVETVMRDLQKALPDDRPITSLCIVEDPANCPPGYTVVVKTFDQDTDADLWKDRMFVKRNTRYLCMSKANSPTNDVLTEVALIGEKETPPSDMVMLMYTKDTEQRAMKKKQICYKLVPKNLATQIVTDVIVLSRSKQVPDGFKLAGEVNSLLICYKVIAGPISSNSGGGGTSVPFTSNGNGADNKLANKISPPLPYPITNRTGAPYPVMPHLYNGTQQVARPISVVEDIPFDFNPKYKEIRRLKEFSIPSCKMKTEEELFREYSYDFSVEYQAQQALPRDLE